MRKISASYIFTLSGPLLKNGIVVADNEGIIREVIDTGGIVSEISGLEYYSGILAPGFVNINSHLELVNNLLPVDHRFISNLKLKDIEELESKSNTYLILYPKSDFFIESQLPDFKLLHDSGFPICIGTDSQASNQNQSMIEELKVIQQNYPLSIQELLIWSCKNGAEALGINNWAGTIEVGKQPGINLISGVDWNRLFLTPKSKVKKLI